MKICIRIISAFLCLSVLSAQKKISRVEIVQTGSYKVDEVLIRNNMVTKAGGSYTPRILDEDIKNLLEKDIASSAEFLAKQDDNSIALRLIVEPLPQLAGISFVGNDEFSNNKLARTTELKAGQPLSDAAIFQARQKLAELYSDCLLYTSDAADD